MLEGVETTLWIQIASLVVESSIVILLAKTVRDNAEVAKVSRLQSEQRFRPWVGPTTGIEFLSMVDGKYQYAITIKNFGEIAANSVIAASNVGNEQPTKQKVVPSEGKGMSQFALGPLLPNMEKRYWIFIDSELMDQAKTSDAKPLFTFVHFSYEFHGGTSGYGMISKFNPKINGFTHVEMWVE